MRIAFAGNPNSGKTTMFNALTGSNERVGNWAGVTVDKKEAPIKKSFTDGKELVAADLPGTYSMSPFTSEEGVTSTYVKNEKPDVIINIVDSTNLSRSLFFTTQLLELGVPMVVALNKSDINDKKGNSIDCQRLSEKLGCPVIETVSTHRGDEGLAELVKAAAGLAGTVQTAPFNQGDLGSLSKEQVKKADRERFRFVNVIVKEVETRKTHTNKFGTQDRIDNILTSKWLGIPIFAFVMFLVFDISQSTLGPYIADRLTAVLEGLQGRLGAIVENAGASDFVSAFLVDGVVGGFIAVVGFLPLVMVMYFLIALLEDCGYMARVSVVLDPMFKKVGLSGKSVIPFVVGTGCAIPGVMACRTIRNERERRAAAMLAPFMPCGAKLPVISLFTGVFFAKNAWVGTLMYFVGIIIIFFGALIINRITGVKNKKSYFIMELPEYKLPSIIRAGKAMCSRGWAYIVKAGTIILVCNTAVQIMQSFTWTLRATEAASESILASIANPLSAVLIPVVGFASWQLTAAAVTGFIAKENVVGTLATCFAISSFIGEDLELIGGAAIVADTIGISAVAALSYMMFNLFTPPCFAAIGAMKSELNSAKWFMGAIGFQLGTGFTVGFSVYQVGTLITTGTLGNGFTGGLCAVLTFAGILVYLMSRAKEVK